MYHDVMVVVLAFLTLFRWPGFLAVVCVFGMVNFPSEEVTVWFLHCKLEQLLEHLFFFFFSLGFPDDSAYLEFLGPRCQSIVSLTMQTSSRLYTEASLSGVTFITVLVTSVLSSL